MSSGVEKILRGEHFSSRIKMKFKNAKAIKKENAQKIITNYLRSEKVNEVKIQDLFKKVGSKAEENITLNVINAIIYNYSDKEIRFYLDERNVEILLGGEGEGV